MTTIYEKLVKINEIKEDIKKAVINKGGTITSSTPFTQYAQAIDAIPSVWGGDESQQTDYVTRSVKESSFNGVYINFKKFGGGNLSTSSMVYTGAANSYLEVPDIPSLNTVDTWEIKTTFTWGGKTHSVIFSGEQLYKAPDLIIENNKLKFSLSSNGATWDIGTNTSSRSLTSGYAYFLKAGFTGTEYYAEIGSTPSSYVRYCTVQSETKVNCTTPIVIGNSPANLASYYFGGDIRLGQTEIILDGESWFTPIIETQSL